MNNYFKNWNIIRLIRLVIGVFIIVQGVQSKDWMLVTLGGVFSLMPIMNIGCCSTNNCNTHTSKNTKDINDISYEEIK